MIALPTACISSAPAYAVERPLPPNAPPNATWTTDSYPPLRFRLSGTTTMVTFIDPKDMQEACGSESPRVIACARGDRIIMPNACYSVSYYGQILCHEVGHIQGWPGYHGD